MRRHLRSTLALLAFLAASPLLAQKHPNIELGFNAERRYQFGDIDSVNLFNGNLVVTIPIGGAYTTHADFKYQLTLVYNSKVWDYDERQDSTNAYYTTAEPNWRSNAGVGWRLSLGRLFGVSPTETNPQSWAFTYEGPTGDEHRFSKADGKAPLSSDTVLYTKDQSHLRLTQANDDRWVEFPNGDVHVFRYDGRWRLHEMRDAFGNSVVITYTTEDGRDTEWKLTDSLGREHHVTFTHFNETNDSEDHGQHVSQIKLATIGGDAIYDFVYDEPTNVPWGCGHNPSPLWDVPETATLPLLTRIDLPDRTSYDFTYYGDANYQSGGYCAQGALQSLTLPTRGVYQYAYQQIDLPEQLCWSPQFASRNPGVKTRTTPDGIWDYVFKRGVEFPVNAQEVGTFCAGSPHPPGDPNVAETPNRQPIYRWVRTSVLSPPVPYGGSEPNGAGQEQNMKRVRTDSYFYAWPDVAMPPAVADGWNPMVSPTQHLVQFGQSMTTGVPSNPAAGFAAQTDVSALSGNQYLSTQVMTGCANDLTGVCTQTLRSTYLRNQAPESQGSDAVFPYPPEATRVLFNDDPNCNGSPCFIDTINTAPDGYGHYKISETQTNFAKGGGFSVFTKYLPPAGGGWLLGLYDRIERTEGNVTAATDYCFDPSTGFLTGIRLLREPVPNPADPKDDLQANDVLTRFAPNPYGDVAYEMSYGGDVQPLPTSSACASPGVPYYLTRNLYEDDGAIRHIKSDYCAPVVINEGSTTDQCSSLLSTLDVDLDSASGLPTASHDPSDVTTTYSYQDLTALPMTTATQGISPTTYTFNLTGTHHSVDISAIATDTAHPDESDQTASHIEYDGIGRVSQTRTLMPGTTWSVVDVRFDGLGRKRYVTEPYLAGTSPAGGTLTEYDPFGRPTRVKAPDGSLASFAYLGNRQRKRTSSIQTAAGATNVDVIEIYDAQGRLAEVQENSGPNPSNGLVKTLYGYDVGGRLKSVEMQGADSGEGSQSREFKYDKIGFLREEKQPEQQRIYYSSYDPKGHASLKTLDDPARNPRSVKPFDLRFTFDKAERLQLVEQQHPSQTFESFLSLKEFAYGSANTGTGSTTNHKKGKLVYAKRWNYDPNPLYPFDDVVMVLETYDYIDPAGRTSARTTRVERNEDLVREVSMAQTYNGLGLPNRLIYPHCVHCTYTATAETRMKYRSGKLWKLLQLTDGNVERSLDEVAYFPNGMTSTIVRGNGVSDQTTMNVMPRPVSETFGAWSQCFPPSAIQVTAIPGLSVTAGQSVQLSVSAQGTSPFSYQWYQKNAMGDWVEIANATSSSVTVTPTSSTSYKVRVSNACHFEESPPVGGLHKFESLPTTITVATCKAPVIETTSTLSQTLPSGASTTLQVTASGTSPLTYSWYLSSNLTTSVATGNTLSLSSVTQSTAYVCKVSNSCGVVTSSTFSIVVPLAAPTILSASRNANGVQIDVMWTGVAGASQYRVKRKSSGGTFGIVATRNVPNYTDTVVTSGTTYVYQVEALDAAGGSVSPPSNADLATMMTFTPVVTNMAIDDAHLTQLFAALTALYTAAGWAQPTWASILPVGVPAPANGVGVRAAHVTALRDSMDRALQALGVRSPGYSDDPVKPGQTAIRAAHVVELQTRAQ